VPIAICTRIGNRKMFVTVLLFCVNLEWPEHFAVLMKAWVSKKLGSIYIYLKILIGMAVWLTGVGSSFNMAPRSEVESTSSDLYGICLKWLWLCCRCTSVIGVRFKY
jgi:hypothetical protein